MTSAMFLRCVDDVDEYSVALLLTASHLSSYRTNSIEIGSDIKLPGAAAGGHISDHSEFRIEPKLIPDP